MSSISESSINLDDYTQIHNGFYFRQSELLGGGSYACVYEGYDQNQKQPIAVKHIKKQDYNRFKDLFQREIDIMKKLKHQNIIQFYGSHFERQDGLFLFIQLCQKENMGKKILQKLKEQETKNYFSQLVDGMAYMNSLKIFHRDLKPDNLLVTKAQKLKIADFGIARQFMETQIQYTKMRCTFYYSAPEILLNYVEYNQKCDVYSAGYILYEMLTCQKIFQKYITEGKSLTQVLKQVRQRGGWVLDHPSLTNKPLWTDLLKRMLQFDPKKRISFIQIKKLLNTLKPTEVLPIFRTVSQQQLYNSQKTLQLIRKQVQYQKYNLNYPINVLLIMDYSQHCKSQFLPRVYKLLCLYLSLAKYCFLARNFIQELSKRDEMFFIGEQRFQNLFKILVVQDKSTITKQLDQLTIKLNKGKEQMKLYLIRQILPEIKKIIMGPRSIESDIFENIPYLGRDIMQFQEKHEEHHYITYENQIKILIERCYMTDVEVNNLGAMDLRIYMILLILKNSKILMDQKQYNLSNLPPTFKDILRHSKQELINFIVLLNRQDLKIPKWNIQKFKNKQE